MNLGGNYLGANQQNQNLEAYRAASEWTPERVSALTGSIDTDVLGTVGRSAAERKKTIAGSLASAGRGGGSSESARRDIDINARNTAATLKNQALLQAGVYTPPGLLTGGGAYNEANPWAASLTGASGTLGNTGNALLSAAMLSKLYPTLFSGG
jgi:hypothetical protein